MADQPAPHTSALEAAPAPAMRRLGDGLDSPTAPQVPLSKLEAWMEPAFTSVPDEIRPRSALPLLALGMILGPELVCRLVQRAEEIYEGRESTHQDLRIHFHRGLPSEGQLLAPRTVDLSPAEWRNHVQGELQRAEEDRRAALDRRKPPGA